MTIVRRGALLVVAVVLAVALAPPGAAASPPLRNVTEGTLLWRAVGEQSYVPAPLLSTDVEMRITGLIVRTTVRQEFSNPTTAWAEGIYVFPLPETAAVDHMRMQVGERIIEGVVQERAAAKATYDAAKQEGRRASLVEQERPNVFTTSVANIAPGAAITIEIEYQQRLPYNAGQYRVRFPMVVGPRYIPGTPAAQTSGGTGWAQATDEVPDAARITPRVSHPSGGPINPVSLRIDLMPEAPLARIDSPYHRITTTPLGAGQYRIELEPGHVPADRDFELVWEPMPGHAPTAALFTEEKGQETFALLMVMPPGRANGAVRVPRETIFVIDTSGSMAGASIEQAKAALDLALARLTPVDSFNVIQFNSWTASVFPSTQPATPANLAQARHYVAGLRAQGGTEMRGALDRALDGLEHPGRLRQVIFLTDGAVGNEAALFEIIRTRLGDSRLFTIGIGSAPNSHFMHQAATHGRGTFTYIGSATEVRDRMDALFRKIEAPVLTDVRLELDATTKVDVLPERIPDLYLGEPVVVSLRADMMPVRAVLRGRIGASEWTQELALHRTTGAAGLSVQWARDKIAALVDTRRTGVSDAEVRQAVLEVALTHHLVSPYTSLVAVDVTPVRPDGADVETHAMKTNLPAGWEYAAVFGTGQGATAASLHLMLGTLALLLAAAGYGALRWRSA
jgi:Ca-activated chloride channel family protein